MRNLGISMVSLLSLQEFMSLIFPRKAPRSWYFHSIFYLLIRLPSCDLSNLRSSPKLLCSLVCNEMMVALASTISWVNPLLSPIFSSSTLSMPSFGVAFGFYPTLIMQCVSRCIISCEILWWLLTTCLFELYKALILRYLPQYMQSNAHESLTRESRLNPWILISLEQLLSLYTSFWKFRRSSSLLTTSPYWTNCLLFCHRDRTC